MDISESNLCIANECFAEYGYNETSVKILSNAMSISSNMFYYLFKNKESLFKIVLADEIEQFKTLTNRLVKRQTDSINSLCAYVTARTMGLQKSKNLLLVINDKSLSQRFLTQELLQDYKDFETLYLKNILQSGVQTGEFEIEDTKLEVSAITSALQQLGRSLNQFSIIDKSEKNLQQMLDTLLIGILKQQTTTLNS